MFAPGSWDPNDDLPVWETEPGPQSVTVAELTDGVNVPLFAIQNDPAVLVADNETGRILRFGRQGDAAGAPLPAAGKTGAIFIEEDVSTPFDPTTPDGSYAVNFTYGPDGQLYVSSPGTNSIAQPAYLLIGFG